MMEAVKLAVTGAGPIGRRHAAHIAAEPGMVPSAIVDPVPASRDFARGAGLRRYPSFEASGTIAGTTR